MGLASSQVSTVQDAVLSKLLLAQGWAESAKTAAVDVLGSLQAFTLPTITFTAPSAIPLTAPVPVTPGAPPVPVYPGVDANTATFVPTGQVGALVAALPTAPTYEVAIEIDNPPTPDMIARPTRPEVGGVVAPGLLVVDTLVAPVISKPEDVQLLPVTVPVFTAPVISAFAVTMPQMEGLPVVPEVTAHFSPDYTSELLTRVLARASDMTDGVGFSEAEVRAAYEALFEPIEHEFTKAVQQAEIDHAARGFDTAPGDLLDAVLELRLDADRKLRGGSEKLRDHVATITKKHREVALGAMLTLEKANAALTIEALRQQVEAEKMRAKVAMLQFNAVLDLFNAVQKGRMAYYEAFKAQIDGYKRVAGATRLAVEGALAKTTVNEGRLDMYAADVKLLRTEAGVYGKSVEGELQKIEAYDGYMQGIMAQADVEVAKMTTYKHDVAGYAAAIDAVTAYVTGEVAFYRAEGSKVEVGEASARLANQYAEVASRIISAYRTAANSQVDVLNANMSAFKAAGNTNESYARTRTSAFRSAVAMLQDQISAFHMGAEAVATSNRAVAEHSVAALQQGLAAAENDTRAQTLAANIEAENTRIEAGIIGAKSMVSAALAQGAMGALNVSASASASGAISSQGSENFTYQDNLNGTNAIVETVYREN